MVIHAFYFLSCHLIISWQFKLRFILWCFYKLYVIFLLVYYCETLYFYRCELTNLLNWVIFTIAIAIKMKNKMIENTKRIFRFVSRLVHEKQRFWYSFPILGFDDCITVFHFLSVTRNCQIICRFFGIWLQTLQTSPFLMTVFWQKVWRCDGVRDP